MGHLPYKAVRATRGKQLRAEPISTLYQRDLIHHVGTFADTEYQQCNWVPGEKSPDRLDANVWGFTELMITNQPTADEQIAAMKRREELNKARVHAQSRTVAPSWGGITR